MIGPNDMKLAKSLVKSGSDHAKFRRMITVYCDILAPLYWWKEFDTYKVGTVANSCSTMHKIADKEFTMDDFSHEHLISFNDMQGWRDRTYTEMDENYNLSPIKNDEDPLIFVGDGSYFFSPKGILEQIVKMLNKCRELYLKTNDKRYWWQMIQLLPSSYNQKRTVMLNYENLANIYRARKNHKLDEWHDFCSWIETLPYADGLIFQREGKTDEDCNTCARINSCEYKPGREELTRYNCPNYSKKESL